MKAASSGKLKKGGKTCEGINSWPCRKFSFFVFAEDFPCTKKIAYFFSHFIGIDSYAASSNVLLPNREPLLDKQRVIKYLIFI